MTTLTLEVYEADGTTLVDTIDPGQFLAAESVDVNSQPGLGKIVLKNQIAAGAVNPALALIEDDRIVRYLIDGTPVWQMVLRTYDDEPVSPRSEAGETFTITSPGLMAIFDKVLWAPDAGLDNQPFHPTRWLNHSADRLRDDDPDGPQGVWPFAVNTPPDYDATIPVFGRPVGMVNTNPQWLWSEDVTADVPAGTCYFRQRYTLASAQDVYFEFAADDQGELWVDGVPIIKIEGIYKGGCVTAVVPLSADDHLISVVGTNLNALQAGVAASWWTVSDGMPDTLLGQLDEAACRVLAYPAKPPGFTPTEVIRLGIDEANVRGMLPDVDVLCNFISASDTEHKPLQEVTDIAVKAPADSLLTTLLMLGQTYLDLSMSPTGVELNAWVRGTRGNAA